MKVEVELTLTKILSFDNENEALEYINNLTMKDFLAQKNLKSSFVFEALDDLI